MFPELETERLRLRMFKQSDFEDYAFMQADVDVMEFLGDGIPRNRDDAWKHLATLIGHWHLRGYGFWAVEEKATGELIGRVGHWNPEGWPDFEVGWILRKESWGKGYATEAGGAALDYAFEQMGRDKVCSVIRVGNERSVNVATKLGETLDREETVMGQQCWIYAITRDVWETRRSQSAG